MTRYALHEMPDSVARLIPLPVRMVAEELARCEIRVECERCYRFVIIARVEGNVAAPYSWGAFCYNGETELSWVSSQMCDVCMWDL